MGNDMRIVKFKMMIRDIWKDLDKYTLTEDLPDDTNGKFINNGWGTAWLAVIYDYDQLNDYGKIIMDQVCMLDEDEFGNRSDEVENIKTFVNHCKDMEYKMIAAKRLALYIKRSIDGGAIVSGMNSYKAIYFIFWALMILAVDDTDKEDYLSLICDFAEMLKIRDVEMMDLVQIIRAIYHMEGNINIQTNAINIRFEKIIRRYRDLSAAGVISSVAGMLGGTLR